jgi:hypothetical protein
MNTEGSELRVNLDPYTLKKVMKDYKKIKKYMKSSIYQIKKMDGSETTVTRLMKELEDT